jgi:hypothetical protein
MILLQSQSTAGAAVIIIVMLLGAAIIGVLTTYFFMKSKYQKIIHELESKLEATEKANVKLTNELAVVKQDLVAKSKEFNQLNEKYIKLVEKDKDAENTKKKDSTDSK